MSEQSSEYDPMSLRSDVDKIYTSPDMVAHARLMRKISRASSRPRYITRSVVTISRPDLFGGSDWEGVRPPVRPAVLNNDAAAQDVLPVVDNG